MGIGGHDCIDRPDEEDGKPAIDPSVPQHRHPAQRPLKSQGESLPPRPEGVPPQGRHGTAPRNRRSPSGRRARTGLMFLCDGSGMRIRCNVAGQVPSEAPRVLGRPRADGGTSAPARRAQRIKKSAPYLAGAAIPGIWIKSARPTNDLARLGRKIRPPTNRHTTGPPLPRNSTTNRSARRWSSRPSSHTN